MTGLVDGLPDFSDGAADHTAYSQIFVRHRSAVAASQWLSLDTRKRPPYVDDAPSGIAARLQGICNFLVAVFDESLF
jgi:hypothetical protein